VQDKNYRYLGQFLISRTLCRLENPTAFGTAYGQGKDWYGTLWRKLKPKTIEGLQDLNAVFVTFNYDRSLEQALMTMARATFKGAAEKTYEECAMSIPIIHVHGQLGRLPWQRNLDGSPSREYGPSDNAELVLQCGSKLHFIGDKAAEDVFEVAKAHLRKAEEIHFVGFGFHPTNLRRLHVDNLGTHDIYGTSVGLGYRDCENLSKGTNVFGKQVNLHPERVETYIHNMVDGWDD